MSQHVRRTHFADELSVQTPTAGVGEAFRFDQDILCRGNRSPAQQDCHETKSHDTSLQIALTYFNGGQRVAADETAVSGIRVQRMVAHPIPLILLSQLLAVVCARLAAVAESGRSCLPSRTSRPRRDQRRVVVERMATQRRGADVRPMAVRLTAKRKSFPAERTYFNDQMRLHPARLV